LSQGVIGVSADWSVHEVMFGDKVCCTGVQTSSEKGRHDEVYQWSPAEKVNEEVIKRKDRSGINPVPDGRFLCPNEPWSKSVKQNLERARQISAFHSQRKRQDGCSKLGNSREKSLSSHIV
jgi:hypothetical protein